MSSDVIEYCWVTNAGLLVVAACSLWAVSAFGIECPQPEHPARHGTIEETPAQIEALSALLASGDVENRIGSIVAGLRRHNPGVGRGEIMSTMTTAYCPVVARLSGLSDAEKRARLARFDRQISHTVYSEADVSSHDAIR